MKTLIVFLRVMRLAFAGSFVFALPVLAAPPSTYIGPIDQAGCFSDLEECHQAATSCGVSNTYYTEQYNLMQQEKPTKTGPLGVPIGHLDGNTICGDWEETSWKVMQDFFEACYLQDWAQSETTPLASSQEKYGHYAYATLKKWEIVSAHYLGSDEPKLSQPMTKTQACQRFFISDSVNSAGSYSEPITLSQCEAKIDECAALYKKCAIPDAENEFITKKTAMCTNKDKDGNFQPPYDVTDHCLAGLKEFGTGVPDQEFCSKIKTFAWGESCTCGEGDISKNKSEGYQQSKGECCVVCQTLEVKYGTEDVECTTATGMKRASGYDVVVENSASCVGVNQSWVKYDLQLTSQGSDEHYYCNLCNQGEFLDKVAAVQVGDAATVVQCTTTKIDFSCGDGKQPELPNPNENEKILLKQVCSLCNTGTVRIKGADQDCSKEVVLPAINPFPNPVAKTVDSPQSFIAVLIKSLLNIIGALALGLVVYGGIVWMTSAGNTQRLEAGRNTLLWALVGLIAVFISSVLVSFLLEKLA